MSKKSKNISKLMRLKEKRARKNAQQAKYISWAEDGKNQKSKRFVLRGKKMGKPVRTERHAMSFCGNVGCKKCYPRHLG